MLTRTQHIRGVLCVGTLVGFCTMWVADLIFLFAFQSHPVAAAHAAEAIGLAAAAFWTGRNWESR